MRVVCSYCRKPIREDPRSRSTDLSHGMCEACSEHFGRLWEGIGLGEYLDGIPHPVMVVEGEGRLVAANRQAGALLGRAPEAMIGLLGGEAMACVHSRLPGGCGKTVHCRECTIRNSVGKVAKTRRALERQPAYLRRADGVHPLRISVRPVDELVLVVIEDVGPAEAA